MTPADFAAILFKVADDLGLELGPLYEAANGDIVEIIGRIGKAYEEREGRPLDAEARKVILVLLRHAHRTVEDLYRIHELGRLQGGLAREKGISEISEFDLAVLDGNLMRPATRKEREAYEEGFQEGAGAYSGAEEEEP
jgi:hypothetical protein